MSNVSTDPIADMLSRLRNALAVNQSEVRLPHSKIKEAIAQLLKDSGFINNVAVSGDGVAKMLELTLNPNNNNTRITEIVRLSKPGRRQYTSAKEIPVVKRGRGLVIVSTSRGLMTGEQAKREGMGGELMCKVY
jgi:small subunit ribosomal protein S8